MCVDFTSYSRLILELPSFVKDMSALEEIDKTTSLNSLNSHSVHQSFFPAHLGSYYYYLRTTSDLLTSVPFTTAPTCT